MCPAGSCCINEAKHDCPEHYFSMKQWDHCQKCTLECKDQPNKLRRKCAKNSMQDQQCVSCGMCGSWPSTGYNCVTNPLDYSSLKDSWCGS